MGTDKKIGVLMGGVSAEREVSLRSGSAVYQALKGSGYHVVGVDAGPDVCRVLRSEGIEIAFLALHGGYGENGAIQGMLEVLGIPYTGSGVLASALAMDKEASKKIFHYHDVPVPPFTVISRNAPGVPAPAAAFPMPWVVKPATEGSSVGVSIVKEREHFEKALGQAYAYGSRVIVEKYIEGKEVHIGILNGKVLGGVEVRPSLEFYNYEAKYTAGLTEYILPPEIDGSVYEDAKTAALSAHNALGCKGATRVDLRIDAGGNPYVLEVNTIPGMTETSLLPKIAGLSGLDFRGLIEEILRGVFDESQ
jgi:D-alanine-D-alanine ligase